MVHRWPFLIPFLFMAAGLTLAAFYGCYCDAITVTAVFSCLILSCYIRSSWLFVICSALFFFLFGTYALQPWLSPKPASCTIRTKATDTPIIIEGVISSRPLVDFDGSRLVVETEQVLDKGRSESVSGRLLLYVSTGDIALSRGDRIRFESRVSVPHLLGLPGEFDYPRYLAFQEIAVTGRVGSQDDIVLIRAAAVQSWQRTVDLAARSLGEAIRSSIANVRVSSVLTALLIGDQRRIPRDLADTYTRAGVNHILSISGFHIGIIAAFISMLIMQFLTRFEYLALRWNIRRVAVMIAAPVMLGYLLLTGAASATSRSVIMLLVFALAYFVEREQDSINTLLLAAFLLVGFNPPILFDVSFQLSFISLWGILVAVPMIMKISATTTSRWSRSLLQFVAASAAASCATLLPVLFIFKVASFNGILTNFIIVPLLGYGAVLSGFVALPVVMILPAAAHILFWPSAKLIAVSNQLITWCASLPVLSFYGITGWDLFFFLTFMVCVTFLRHRLYLVTTGVLIPVAAVILHVYAAYATDDRLHITMLSVGQAESMLIRLPNGSTMLVDGGGYLHDTGHDFGQRLLAPALGSLHAGSIDRMIATHNHPDHSGGLPYVIRNFDIKEFWSVSDIAPEVQDELQKRQVPQRTVTAGDVITLPDGVVLTVLSPAGAGRRVSEGDESSVNEQSLVFRLRYGSFSMIFSADAGFEAERRMLADGYDLHSTVLKVGHHGSRFSTSEQFLEQVHPDLAIISAGAGNRFGLPSPRTVSLLESKRIPIYRTDRDGTIEIISDGSSWTVSGSRKPE